MDVIPENQPPEAPASKAPSMTNALSDIGIAGAPAATPLIPPRPDSSRSKWGRGDHDAKNNAVADLSQLELEATGSQVLDLIVHRLFCCTLKSFCLTACRNSLPLDEVVSCSCSCSCSHFCSISYIL